MFLVYLFSLRRYPRQSDVKPSLFCYKNNKITNVFFVCISTDSKRVFIKIKAVHLVGCLLG